MIEKSSAVLAGSPRNKRAGLCKMFSSTYSMHFVVSSGREDWLEFLTRTASGNESLGSARNSGKPPSEDPGRNCLPSNLDLNFATISSLGSGSNMLVVLVKFNRRDEAIILDPFMLGLFKRVEILQVVERTRLDIICVVR